jgi:hypothetical protein
VRKVDTPLSPDERPELRGPEIRGPEFGAPDVGDFRLGTPQSRWALGHYLIGRAIIADLDRALYLIAVGTLIVAALAWWFVSPWLGVPLVLIALSVLAVRALAGALLRGLTGAGRRGSGDERLRALVDETGGDVRRELRRIGLPSRPWTLPLLALRLLGRRRRETLVRMSEFRADNVVSAARVDELHLLLKGGGLAR